MTGHAGRPILDFVKNDEVFMKPVEETIRVFECETAFQGVIERDIIRYVPEIMNQKCRFSRLARTGDQGGRKLLDSVFEYSGKRTLNIHMTNIKLNFVIVKHSVDSARLIKKLGRLGRKESAAVLIEERPCWPPPREPNVRPAEPPR